MTAFAHNPDGSVINGLNFLNPNARPRTPIENEPQRTQNPQLSGADSAEVESYIRAILDAGNPQPQREEVESTGLPSWVFLAAGALLLFLVIR